mmetsp:Transcript_57797/g.124987  ORF Transcript_57797/g.124987 Transcript_57797/m.124987 type:complete len:662 (-) Transcript_57797:319-2304(-)
MGCLGSKASPAVSMPRPAEKGQTPDKAPSPFTASAGNRIVLQKYEMFMGKEGVLGEGSFCVCRKGIDKVTGKNVAIKAYKVRQDRPKDQKVLLLKFTRQIEVLKSMQEPLRAADMVTRHAHPELEKTLVNNVFIQLLDYSKDANGNPGNDPKDGQSYVVTELAEYSMKDYLADRKERKKALSKEDVVEVTKQVILVVAALHAKKLVHLDLKPENLMWSQGHWKLIDVDGCVKFDQTVQITDSTISFSPCYCAPEWARFLIADSTTLKVNSLLDVWSVGMTISELVSLNPILKPKYASFLKQGLSHREAGFYFMEWLSTEKSMPLPEKVKSFDPQFLDLLQNWILVPDAMKRKTLAECLDHPYIKSAKGATQVEPGLQHRLRIRDVDVDKQPPMFEGTLMKLNTDGDPAIEKDWLRRDMYIAKNGSLAYFSMKENKRLVLVSRAKLLKAKITSLDDPKPFAFKMDMMEEEGHFQSLTFAADSEEARAKWLKELAGVAKADWFDPKTVMLMSDGFAKGLREFKLRVHNRRTGIDPTKNIDFKPVFKDKLWKVGTEKDYTQHESWFLRDMWIAQNGALCYFSAKENKELIHYNYEDIAGCEIHVEDEGKFPKPFAFTINLAKMDGLEVVPGIFATETREKRDQWIAALEESRKKHPMFSRLEKQ